MVTLLVAAVVLVMQLTSDDSEAAAPTTTAPLTEPSTTEPFSVAQIATGDPLAWQLVTLLDDVWPISIVEHNDQVFLFGTRNSIDTSLATEPGIGLETWVSSNGLDWETRGPTIPEDYRIRNVVSTPRGLVAVGASSVDGAPVVLLSPDGQEWASRPLPMDDTLPDWVTIEPTMATGTDQVIVVAGSYQIDQEQRLRALLPEELDLGVDTVYHPFWTGPPWRLAVQGPFGLTIYEASAGELGLSEEEVERAYVRQYQSEIPVWSSTDGATWSISTMDAQHLQGIFQTSDDRLTAVAFTAAGPVALSSDDGHSWERVGSREVPIDVVSWRGGLLGLDWDSTLDPLPTLSFSIDGEVWEHIEGPPPFPNAYDWAIYNHAAGSAGIAAAVAGYDTTSAEAWLPEPLVLERDGTTLTVDDQYGRLHVTRGAESHSWALRVDHVQDGMMVDLERRTISFHDRESGEELIAFGLEELNRAYRTWRRQVRDFNIPHSAFLFSPDGSTWSVSDAADIFGDSWVQALAVTTHGVVATVTDRAPYAFWQRSIPDIEIWLGTP